jgi:hypothetical protein
LGSIRLSCNPFRVRPTRAAQDSLKDLAKEADERLLVAAMAGA